ncbi:MAG: hypothetical protein KKC77_15285 [Proteobacteria bacterium]|nr:hypothetical protein [Pseudomonadota bacterium]
MAAALWWVGDGDTITILGNQIKLYGIDTSEKSNLKLPMNLWPYQWFPFQSFQNYLENG